MKIGARTAVQSLTALILLLIITGALSYLCLDYYADKMDAEVAESRVGWLQSAIREDSLQMKDRALKASLAVNPGSLFPGMTYCDVYVKGDTSGRVLEGYIGPELKTIKPVDVLRSYLTAAREVSPGLAPVSQYGEITAGRELIIFGTAPTGPDTLIVVGKVIDTAYEQKLARLNDYPVDVRVYSGTKGAEVEAAKKALLTGQAVYAAPSDQEWTNAYGLLRDQAGHPIGIIKAVVKRYEPGFMGWLMAMVIGSMAAVGLGVTAVNLAGVRFGLTNRLRGMLRTIGRVRGGADLSRRIPVVGDDELSQTASALNDMLSSLEQTHHQEFLSGQMYARLAEATHDRVIVFGPDRRVEFINEEASLSIDESPDDVTRPGWTSPLSASQLRTDQARLDKAFKTGQSEHIENEREFADGKRWVDTWLIPIKDEKDRVVRVLVSSRDITEKKKALDALTKARDFYIYLFDNFPSPVWRVDAAGRCNYANKAAVKFTGKEVKDLMGEGWVKSVHPKDAADRARIMEQAARTKTHAEIEYRLRGYDGTYRWVIDYVQPIYDLRKKFAGFYGTIVDVTESRLKAEELAYMATHDGLTDTANRRRFDEEIENAVAKAKRGEESVLLYFDIDDFKNVNDALGHLEGDRVLADVARAAKKVIRKEEMLARMGGDEFAVILEGQSVESALTTSERLISQIEGAGATPLKNPTISVGITAITAKTTAAKAIKEADAAMYEAKRRGGNRAVVFAEGLLDYNL